MRRITRKAQQGFTLIELMIVVAIVGILAVLAIYGVSKYMTNAKTAEARNALGMMGKAAVSAYEAESTSSAILALSGSSTTSHGLCLPATAPVPAAIPKGVKYQSSTAEWFLAADTPRTGFTCLKFSLTEPQYFRYGYESDATATTSGDGFAAWAESDLKGEEAATLSFTLKGAIAPTTKQVVVSPSIEEFNKEADKVPGKPAS